LADVLNPVKIQAQIAEQKRQAVSDQSAALKLSEQQKAATRQATLEGLAKQYGNDPVQLDAKLREGGFLDEANALQDHALKATSEHLQVEAAKTAQTAAAVKLTTSMLNAVHDDATLTAFKQAASGIFQDPQVRDFVIQQVGDTYDPAKIDAAKQLGMSQAEIADQQDAAIRRALTSAQTQKTLGDLQRDHFKQAAELLAASSSPLAYQQHLAFIAQQDPTIAKQFGTAGTAQDIESAKKMAMGAESYAQTRIGQQNANTAAENARIAGTREQREARAAAGTLDPETDTRTTLSGMKYVDLNDFETPTAKDAARKAAKAQGLTVVDKATGDTLRAADTARLNLEAMWGQIQSKLPKDASGRVIAGPGNRLKQYFQSDADVAAFNSWRAGAIQAVQALVERGMGFRLNQAEINMIMQNDMPQVTDTVQTAKQRVDNVLKLLDDKEKVALTRDRSTLGSVTGQNPFRK
jgi:hypothetical protein